MPSGTTDWPDFAVQRRDYETQLAKLSDSSGKIRHSLLLELAEYEYLTGEPEQAREHYQQVLDETELDEDRAIAHLGLGWINYTHSGWTTSEDHIREGFDHTTTSKTRANLFVLLSLLAYRHGSYDDAIRYCKTALELSPDTIAGGLAHSFVGIVLHAQGENIAALDHWERARALARQLKAPDIEARVLNNRGVYHYYTQGEYEQARSSFERAAALSEQVNFNLFLGFPYINLGGVYHEVGNYEQSIAAHAQAEIYFQRVGDRMMEGALNIELSRVYRQQKEYEKALANLDRALDLVRKYGSQRYLVFTYREMGLLHRDQNHWNDALADLRLARELAIIIQDHVLQEEIERYQSECRILRTSEE